MSIDFMSISGRVHSFCNHKYYYRLLSAIEKILLEYNCVFTRDISEKHQIAENSILFAAIAYKFSIEQIFLLEPFSRNHASEIKWRIDDRLLCGFSETWLRDIIDALEQEGIYINSKNAIEATFPDTSWNNVEYISRQDKSDADYISQKLDYFGIEPVVVMIGPVDDRIENQQYTDNFFMMLENSGQ